MVPLDSAAATELVMRLMAVPGKSCEEGLIAEEVSRSLQQAGVSREWITFDQAHLRTRVRGQVGNMIVHIPGTKPGPTVLFSAHLDTVPICVGCKPQRVGEMIQSADPTTGLGADNRAGVAAIIAATSELKRSQVPHLPLVLCFFVQEEIGLQGSRHLDRDQLGPIDLAVNFDGGNVEKLTVGATGGERMSVDIRGIPSHAGIAPEAGVNASSIASLAIADLLREGWIGRVERREGSGTSNVGVVQGGEATNVVMPQLTIRAEARSHDSVMRRAIVAAFERAFSSAVEQVCAIDGRRGEVHFSSHVDYDSFRLDEGAPSVAAARASLLAIGRHPFAEVAGGGLDANWLFRHGIHAVTLGCGQRQVHTTEEKLDLADFLDACRVVIDLATR